MQKLKVAILGDAHLGKRQYNLIEREKDFYESWLDLCVRVGQLSPDLLILTGDIFDSKDPSPIAVSCSMEGIRKTLATNVVAIEGNHDRSAYHTKGVSWHDFLFELGVIDQALSPANNPYETDQVCVYGIPWCGMANANEYEAMVWEAHIHKRLPGKPFIGVTHQSISGYGAYEEGLPIDHVSASKSVFDVVAVGHMHNRFSNNFLFCAGAPESCSVSEAANIGGAWVLEFLGSKLASTEFIESKKRPFLLLRILSNDTDFIVNYVTDECEKRDLLDPVIVVEIVGPRIDEHVLGRIKSDVEQSNVGLHVIVSDKMDGKDSDVNLDTEIGTADLIQDALSRLLEGQLAEKAEKIYNEFMDDDASNVINILMGEK